LEDVLNETGGIEMAKADFVAEWKEPLVRLLSALRKCGYQRCQIDQMKELEQVVEELPKTGILYRNE